MVFMMKYLKLFESFNDKWEIMSDDEFWQKESEFKLQSNTMG